MTKMPALRVCAVLLLVLKLVVSQQPTPGSCHTVTVPLCNTLPYRAFLPNRFSHRSMEDAGLEIHQFYPLVKVQCSPALKPFLCATYFPQCSPRGGGIEACASLCRQARQGCEGLLNRFGFQWPESLNCSTFSESYRCLTMEDIGPM